ncbi:MAG: hypothetical protein HY735_24355 [Verrucomicrobia bacterium]|nr:hypothetical protein [Verrucomicrobiota bacterium]
MPPEKIESAHFSPDTRAFIALLHEHAVRYVIVGGEAVIFHGYARLTGDVDFFYERTEANARALFAALTQFWAGAVPGIAAWNELLEAGVVIQFGRPPNRIDLLNVIDGVEFQQAWATRQTVEMEVGMVAAKVLVHFLGLPSLLKNKEAAGRPKDLEDLRYLRRSAEESQQ